MPSHGCKPDLDPRWPWEVTGGRVFLTVKVEGYDFMPFLSFLVLTQSDVSFSWLISDLFFLLCIMLIWKETTKQNIKMRRSRVMNGSKNQLYFLTVVWCTDYSIQLENIDMIFNGHLFQLLYQDNLCSCFPLGFSSGFLRPSGCFKCCDASDVFFFLCSIPLLGMGLGGGPSKFRAQTLRQKWF